ncbi:uncharacterized protein [Watersipora subatra]|uniref:uncharacterized protein n=1 Tax=Watersipora subatra TaxID=2589382 RepID=UPI00355C29E2
MIWYQLRDQERSNRCSGFRVWLILLAAANIIDVTISDYKTSISWLIGYYAVILAENIAMVGIWYSALSEFAGFQQTLWLVAAFASFSVGLLLSLVVLTLTSREKSGLQKLLDRGCPCGDKLEDESSFFWDSYNSNYKPKGIYNKAFVIEDRQKHVDILNNPLGVSDVVSLTTAATTGPSSPSDGNVVESPSHTDHLRRPLAKEKQVKGK